MREREGEREREREREILTNNGGSIDYKSNYWTKLNAYCP